MFIRKKFAANKWRKYAAVLLLLGITSNIFAHERTIYLDQGWTTEQRKEFYETPQGSYLIPLDWYLSLEQVDSNDHGRKHRDRYDLFSDDDNVRKFGYLVKKRYDGDVQNIPLGFAVESVENGSAWLGYTCAACHTNEIEYRGRTIRIDGAPTLADLMGFISQLHAAVVATLEDEQKFNRFSDRLLGSHHSAESAALREALRKYAADSAGFFERNHSDVEYGFGRLDAFGIIMNELFVHDLGVPENRFSPNGPVSYPFLWGTPQHDFVQWHGSASDPLGRNIGEVLGTFGEVNLMDPNRSGQSTVRIPELIQLENLVATLKTPQWPEKYLGKIDQEKAAWGRALYEQVRGNEPSCVSCHALKDEEGQYPLTPAEENFYGKRFVITNMSPLAEIGTDPTMALNFATRVISTGNLSPLLPPPFTNATELPAPLLLRILVNLAEQTALSELQPPLSPDELAAATGYRVPAEGFPPYRPKNILAYRARPLDGIWATAPYLHNGSIQNLYELLKPGTERERSFYVGSRQFDPKHVGFKSKKRGNRFLLDTTAPSNSNLGHEYGVGLSEVEKWALIEFLKTL